MSSGPEGARPSNATLAGPSSWIRSPSILESQAEKYTESRDQGKAAGFIRRLRRCLDAIRLHAEAASPRAA